MSGQTSDEWKQHKNQQRDSADFCSHTTEDLEIWQRLFAIWSSLTFFTILNVVSKVNCSLRVSYLFRYLKRFKFLTSNSTALLIFWLLRYFCFFRSFVFVRSFVFRSGKANLFENFQFARIEDWISMCSSQHNKRNQEQ